MRRLQHCLAALLFLVCSAALAQDPARVVDIPTRPGVTQRLLVLAPAAPTKAAVILLPGGQGGLQIFPNGSMNRGDGNFLVRSRQHFAAQGLFVVVADAPSDRQSPPYLAGFRQTPEHAADLKAVIAWTRETAKVPVWLVGTSRGTQSAGYLATEVSGPEGPDGLVFTSTILTDPRGRAVPAMPLERIRIPVLVVHHEQDGCSLCPYPLAATLVDKLVHAPRKQLLSISGGSSRGDPCEAFAYHGFNGMEAEVVNRVAAWMAGN
ncbi:MULTISPECIES: alpha/beta hydrolase [Ramlibacter]|uniref:Alpha/beta hydrolase n=1 Tax=Ramlibacter pinisoli TaxID=2682844 RepID=A0A6N8IQR6_9BURK|nr:MULTISPECIES: alpha/beta hydrolase [Ramlibacter]MBA2964283.1 alpha/beta hydrolase [Ramlibacter sp. CGMCC 1.13660]MVQ29249.1 alpha/beta hydrolase [Ramlibacter pinisoli]